jgi:hypothetical protein
MQNYVLGRRSFLVTTPTALAALKLIGCGADAAAPATASGAQQAAVTTPGSCTTTPTAYVFGGASASLGAALSAAGFDLQTLPLDRSPIELGGLIVLPAFVSESADYERYMMLYAADLFSFVDSANVLLQLAQSKETEPTPPFLPTTHTAERGSAQLAEVWATDVQHPLLENVALTQGRLALRREDLAVDAFASEAGFEVILADPSGQALVLMEGAYGQGRLLLSALSLEYAGDAAGDAFTKAFCANLFVHVRDVCARAVPALEIATTKTLESFSPGSQLLAALPDTQVYSLRLPGLLSAQTSWLREHAERLDIRYALQLGDTTNNNTTTEWVRAAAAFELLRGVVPYAIAPGNHDYGPSGNAATRDTLFNEHFAYDLHATQRGFGGAYELGKLDNTYHLFSIGGRDVLLLALEWAPRDELVAWAHGIMLQHPERDGILITHAYLNNDELRYDHTDTTRSQRFNPHDYRTPGTMNDGEELWQKLVRHHRFIITLNGHVLGDGCGYLASTTDKGNTCHQMLSNYQMREQGGEGYMRLLEFLSDGKRVRVRTYSPLYDKFLDDQRHNFDLVLD